MKLNELVVGNHYIINNNVKSYRQEVHCFANQECILIYKGQNAGRIDCYIEFIDPEIQKFNKNEYDIRGWNFGSALERVLDPVPYKARDMYSSVLGD